MFIFDKYVLSIGVNLYLDFFFLINYNLCCDYKEWWFGFGEFVVVGLF